VDQKALIKFALIGGGLAALYFYLRSSGLLDQWFGGNSTFDNSQQLLAYCRQNPTGSASFVDPQGQAHSAPCAQWLASNSANPTPAATIAADPVAMVDRLRKWAIDNPILGTDSANVDQWNYGFQELKPAGFVPVDNSKVGIERGVNDVMNAAKYMQFRGQLGLAGLAGYGPTQEAYQFPAWLQ